MLIATKNNNIIHLGSNTPPLLEKAIEWEYQQRRSKNRRKETTRVHGVTETEWKETAAIKTAENIRA